MSLNGQKLEFVSYDGEYPNLCSGTLRFKVGDEDYAWDHCLTSGGSVYFTNGYADEHVDSGPWSVDFPNDFPEILRPAVTEMVNHHVQWGCCGGCI